MDVVLGLAAHHLRIPATSHSFVGLQAAAHLLSIRSPPPVPTVANIPSRIKFIFFKKISLLK
jgi:hypothetical protein